MLIVKKNHLKLKKKEFQFLKHLCRCSKNLYNKTLYQTRQHYFNCGEFLNYIENYKLLKNSDVFKSLPSDPAQQTMKVVERNFRSFFGLLKKKQKGNYNRQISIPHYLDKQGYFLVFYPTRPNRMKDNFSILVPKNLQEKFGFKKLTIDRPEYTKNKKLKEIRILPKMKGGYFEIEWVYEEILDIKELDSNTTLGIDLGVSNFATCVNSNSGHSFILDGKLIKSYNRYFNKTMAKLKSIHDKIKLKSSKRKSRMYLKRNNILKDALNQYVNYIIKYCIHHKIENIIVGQGYLAQQNSDLGKSNNQNFTQIPFGKFCQKLQWKCEKYGINYSSINESYTSKCDHLANEEMIYHEEYLGKRIKRGLFSSSTGVLLNADVNGALGMIIKGKHKVDLNQLVSSGCLTQPSRISLLEIKDKSAIQVINEN
ncbi:MAG: transposase [Clostridia bacterium]|jgi:IS605 OrfB family transposase